jgi:hypothetical protein
MDNGIAMARAFGGEEGIFWVDIEVAGPLGLTGNTGMAGAIGELRDNGKAAVKAVSADANSSEGKGEGREVGSEVGYVGAVAGSVTMWPL